MVRETVRGADSGQETCALRVRGATSMAINKPADGHSAAPDGHADAGAAGDGREDVLFPDIDLSELADLDSLQTPMTPMTPVLGDDPHAEDTPDPGKQQPAGGLNLLLNLIDGRANVPAEAAEAARNSAAAPKDSPARRPALPDPPEPDSGAHPEWSEILPAEGPAAKALRDEEKSGKQSGVPRTLELRVQAMLEQLPALLTSAVDELESRNQHSLERQWGRHRQSQEERLARMEVRIERLAEQVHLIKIRDTETGATPVGAAKPEPAQGRYMLPIFVIGLLGLLAGIVMGTLLLSGG